MLFSCFGVLLNVIATNQRNPKMVLPKQFVEICMSYDPNHLAWARSLLPPKIVRMPPLYYWQLPCKGDVSDSNSFNHTGLCYHVQLPSTLLRYYYWEALTFCSWQVVQHSEPFETEKDMPLGFKCNCNTLFLVMLDGYRPHQQTHLSMVIPSFQL